MGIVDFFKSSYGKIASVIIGAFALMLLGWQIFSSNPVHTAKKIPVNWAQEKISFTGGKITFTDSTGKTTTREEPENSGDIEQSITIQDSTETKRLFVEQTGSWFPEITGRPTAQIVGLGPSDVRGVTATNQIAPLFGIDTDAIVFGGGYSFGSGPAAFGAYTPIQIWAFRFGPSLVYTTNKDFSLQGAVTVELRESLYITTSASPDVFIGGEDKQLFVGLGYRF